MKIIPNTNDMYEFDNDGNVYSLHRNNRKLLKVYSGKVCIKFVTGRKGVYTRLLKNLYSFLDEESKIIDGYSNYAITKDGRIFSLTTNLWVRTFNDKDNYKRVAIVGDDGVRRKFRVGRLVALTYIPNYDNLPLVNHIDENKRNDSVENLEWCSYQYNVLYSINKKLQRSTTIS